MSKYQYTVQGVDYDVEVESIEGTTARVTVNGKPFEVEIKHEIKVTSALKRNTVVAAVAPKAEAPKPEAPKAETHKAPAPADVEGSKITAPLPGTITEVNVAVGDSVKTGDTVVMLEAMKMQNSIEADTNGTVKAVNVRKGDTVMEGTVLVVIG